MTDSRYITNDEYRRQKSRLTRAVNSGDPVKVLSAVEKTVTEWEDKAWPDDWSRWFRALDDARLKYIGAGWDDERDSPEDIRILSRFDELNELRW